MKGGKPPELCIKQAPSHPIAALHADPIKRPTVQDILHHPWCAGGLSVESVLQCNDTLFKQTLEHPTPAKVPLPQHTRHNGGLCSALSMLFRCLRADKLCSYIATSQPFLANVVLVFKATLKRSSLCTLFVAGHPCRTGAGEGGFQAPASRLPLAGTVLVLFLDCCMCR